MNERDALDLLEASIWTVVVVAGPPVIIAMIAGIVVALVQALTQVQEASLTFIPKMITILLVMIVFSHSIGVAIWSFTTLTVTRIEYSF